MSKATERHNDLMELVAEVNTLHADLYVLEYDESAIYTIRVRSSGLHQPSLIGNVEEAIAYVRGVKAALEVLA